MTLYATYSTTLVAVSCYSCGFGFGLPDDYQRLRLEDHKDWYCPNGHRQHYIGETEAQKLARQLGYARDRSASLQASLDQTEAERRAWKGQTTRLKNRAHAGLCAFCRRNFANVAAHMATEHPEPTADASSEPPSTV